MRYLIVDLKTKEVLNAVEWDGKSTWGPPQGTTAIPDEHGVADLRDTVNDLDNLKAGVTKAKPLVRPEPVKEEPIDEILGDLGQSL